MQMRYPSNPEKVKQFTTDQLRDEFLIERLFSDDAINLVYSHIDRIIVGGACPVTKTLDLTASPKDLGADYFLERREVGIVNVGGAGTVTVDGTAYPMAKLDGLYVGKGAKSVQFTSADSATPAHFYFTSTPRTPPTRRPTSRSAAPRRRIWAASPTPTSGRSTSTSTRTA